MEWCFSSAQYDRSSQNRKETKWKNRAVIQNYTGDEQQWTCRCLHGFLQLPSKDSLCGIYLLRLSQACFLFWSHVTLAHVMWWLNLQILDIANYADAAAFTIVRASWPSVDQHGYCMVNINLTGRSAVKDFRFVDDIFKMVVCGQEDLKCT